MNEKGLVGTIFTSGMPQVAEIIAGAGFEWVLIDMEHSAMSLEQVQVSLPLFGNSMLRIVRVPANDEAWIKRVLDTGCDGIMVPMVRSAEEAERAVRFSKYPPDGRRSVGVTRAHGYGNDFSTYMSRANDDIIVMVQAEHIDSVRQIDAIVHTEGVNAVFIGPYDLSASMNLTGQVSHAHVREAIHKIKDKCHEVGMPYGIFGATPESVTGELEEGCRYLLCGIDMMILASSYKKLHQYFRKA